MAMLDRAGLLVRAVEGEGRNLGHKLRARFTDHRIVAAHHAGWGREWSSG